MQTYGCGSVVVVVLCAFVYDYWIVCDSHIVLSWTLRFAEQWTFIKRNSSCITFTIKLHHRPYFILIIWYVVHVSIKWINNIILLGVSVKRFLHQLPFRHHGIIYSFFFDTILTSSPSVNIHNHDSLCTWLTSYLSTKQMMRAYTQ